MCHIVARFSKSPSHYYLVNQPRRNIGCIKSVPQTARNVRTSSPTRYNSSFLSKSHRAALLRVALFFHGQIVIHKRRIDHGRSKYSAILLVLNFEHLVYKQLHPLIRDDRHDQYLGCLDLREKFAVRLELRRNGSFRCH